MLDSIARALADSPVRTFALYLLGNIPGFPPIIQTVHLLSVVAVMGSVVLINLRVLGLALPSQDASELTRRLMRWTWWALPFLALSGLVFVFARPNRYLVNPVFGLKFSLLAPAVVLSSIQQRLNGGAARFSDHPAARRTLIRVLAACSLALWLGVVMAGRWIAYSDYIFPPE
jgi:hypothetical protein